MTGLTVLSESAAEFDRWTAALTRDETQLDQLWRQIADLAQTEQAERDRVAHTLADVQRAAAADEMRQALLTTQRLIAQIQRGRALTWELLFPGESKWIILRQRETAIDPDSTAGHEFLHLQSAPNGNSRVGVHRSAAFIWAYVTGEVVARRTVTKAKKHGHRAVSVFRLGLDQLQDLLLHPCGTSWRTLGTLMPRFEGESAR